MSPSAFPRFRPSGRTAGRETVRAATGLLGGELSALAFAELTAALRSSVAELAFTQAEMVTRLRRMVERPGDETGAHMYRVSRFSARLASLAGLDAERCELIRLSSALHDVGKAAIPDAVLLKPGALNYGERAFVETHAQLGYELLKNSGSKVLRVGATIAWTHHEKYDGSGYPRGLAAAQIPIECRIVTIADVYDALSSDRVYRPAFAPERVREMMSADRGSHFDPDLLDLFLAGVDEGAMMTAAPQDALRRFWSEPAAPPDPVGVQPTT